MKETLRIFLVKHRCYRAFVKNYKQSNPTNSFDEYLKRYEAFPNKIIVSAFDWGKTEKKEQGVYYWWSISNKWNEYLKSQKN